MLAIGRSLMSNASCMLIDEPSVGLASKVKADLFDDPQLKHRQHFQTVDHPEIGPHTIEIPSMHFSNVPHQPLKKNPFPKVD